METIISISAFVFIIAFMILIFTWALTILEY